jgi:hypothetical protein
MAYLKELGAIQTKRSELSGSKGSASKDKTPQQDADQEEGQ